MAAAAADDEGGGGGAPADAAAPDVESVSPRSRPAATTTGPRPAFGVHREELQGGGYYEGPFRFAKRDTSRGGTGTLVCNTEGTERYEGQFLSERMHGFGKKVWADGCIYEGQWEKDRKHGQGALQEPDGKCYTGQWVDGRRHGNGRQISDRYSYEGRWENGMLSGSGKLSDFKDGSVFEGQWRQGAHHGPGLIRKAGAREKVNFAYGALTGQETLSPPTEYIQPPLRASSASSPP